MHADQKLSYDLQQQTQTRSLTHSHEIEEENSSK